jgi:hypothetical protein
MGMLVIAYFASIFSRRPASTAFAVSVGSLDARDRLLRGRLQPSPAEHTQQFLGLRVIN